MGNLYQSPDKTDREYGLGGRLERRGSWRYKYDEDGHLIEKYKGSGGFFGSKKEHWRYHWDSFGMLREVHRPDGDKVRMTYDALGRRLSKKYKNTTTKWLWSGNTPLHEWKESRERKFKDGEDYLTTREHSHTMWVFEDNSFVPCAKIKNGKTYSIITDHLGTPTQMYNDEGESVWEQELDIYGNVRKFANKDYAQLPFRYQGQYYDREIDLCYNRFRYYDTELGRYISEDPIGFASGEFNFYNYVDDCNSWIDPFGLSRIHKHHSDPKFMGGKHNQPLTTMSEPDHVQLHRDMNALLETKTKVIDGKTVSMRPKRGNRGSQIRENFTRNERLDALAEFYSKNKKKYPQASADFFSQHPHLQKTGCKP